MVQADHGPFCLICPCVDYAVRTPVYTADNLTDNDRPPSVRSSREAEEHWGKRPHRPFPLGHCSSGAMSGYGGRTVFHSSPWMVIATAVAAILFISAASFLLSRDGLTVLALLVGVLALVATLGVVETVVQRIVLTDAALRVRGLRGYAEYGRTEIARVSYAKGSAVVVQLKDGKNVRLPDLGSSAQAITNSIRAWVKASNPSEYSPGQDLEHQRSAGHSS